MKIILRVAKTELRTLFYSPIAWFLMVVFLIQCGIVYFSKLDDLSRTQELGGYGLQYMNNITLNVFLSPGALFGNVMQNLYLYIPLLTMSLISRETSSGTIKLLYSSPIKVREIVLGKYLAMMAYSLLMVAIVAIFVVSGVFHIEHAETAMLMTALLGFYLLLLAYSAIGLFMSTLTTYQVVAAICTFVMIGVLSYIGTLWQRIEFVRELTYFLSINGRTSKMLQGLLTTKDFIYFFVIVYIFLGFSVLKLRSGMESKPASIKALRYVGVVALGLLAGYISSFPNLIGYYDATHNKINTLTPRVQNILKEMDGAPLEVTLYTNLLDNYARLGSPDSYNLNQARWEPYQRFKNDIKIKNVTYYDSALINSYMYRNYPNKTLKEIAEQYAKNSRVKLKNYLTPQQIRKQIDLTVEKNRFVMQLKWKDRTTFLRVFDDNKVWPGETEVAAALKRLLRSKLPKIGFVTGELERDINKMGERDYKAITNLATFRSSLINQGFDVQEIETEVEEIPIDIAAIVLADPKIELGEAGIARLKKYIDEGRNLLIAGEPGRQAILNPLLNKLGVQLMEGTVIQESKDLAPNIAAPDMTKFVGTFTQAIKYSVADSIKVSMPGAAGLTWTSDSGFAVQPLLVTNAKLTWNRIKPLDLELMTKAKTAPPVRNIGGTLVEETVEGPPNANKAAATPKNRLSSAERKKLGEEHRKRVKEIFEGPGTQEEKQAKLKTQTAKFSKEMGMGIISPQMKNKDSLRAAQARTMKGGGATSPAADHRSSRRASAGTVSFNPADGDVKGPITTAVSLTRRINGKEQRIVITGDADFMSNAEVNRFNLRTANFSFSTALFSWLSYGEFPVDTSRPEPKDKRVNVTMDQVGFLKIMYIWVLPAILFACGAIVLIRRKRK